MKKLICLFVTYSLCGSMIAFASDEASLNQAINSLNARAKTDAEARAESSLAANRAARENVAIADERDTSRLWGVARGKLDRRGQWQELECRSHHEGRKELGERVETTQGGSFQHCESTSYCREHHPGRSRWVTRPEHSRDSSW